jgi:hypothetical protein
MKIAASILAMVLIAPAADSAGESIPAHSPQEGGKGLVATYPAVETASGMDYDEVNGWVWQTSMDMGETVTVDPAMGSYTSRFLLTDVVPSADTQARGLYYDEEEEHLYFTDTAEGGSTTTDYIYCLDVSDPDAPFLVEAWDLGTTDNISGIAYRDPYFYCGYGGNDVINTFTFSPGGGWVLHDTYSVAPESMDGGMFYHEADDVFYISDCLSTDIFVVEGANPANTLGCFSAGAELFSGLTLVDGFYLWGSNTYTDENYVFENDYLAFEASTWGSIKAVR